MIVKVNGCVDCDLPCSSYCKHRDNLYEYYCDNCMAEDEQLYYFGNQELCIDCIKECLEKVN